MVHTCVMCCNNSNNNKDISFHQFPKDILKKALWLKVLNLTSVSSWHKVCSQHFKPSYFNFNYNRHILKSTAVLIGNCNALDDHNYASGVLPSSPTCLRFPNTTIVSEE